MYEKPKWQEFRFYLIFVFVLNHSSVSLSRCYNCVLFFISGSKVLSWIQFFVNLMKRLEIWTRKENTLTATAILFSTVLLYSIVGELWWTPCRFKQSSRNIHGENVCKKNSKKEQKLDQNKLAYLNPTQIKTPVLSWINMREREMVCCMLRINVHPWSFHLYCALILFILTAHLKHHQTKRINSESLWFNITHDSLLPVSLSLHMDPCVWWTIRQILSYTRTSIHP